MIFLTVNADIDEFIAVVSVNDLHSYLVVIAVLELNVVNEIDLLFLLFPHRQVGLI